MRVSNADIALMESASPKEQLEFWEEYPEHRLELLQNVPGLSKEIWQKAVDSKTLTPLAANLEKFYPLELRTKKDITDISLTKRISILSAQSSIPYAEVLRYLPYGKASFRGLPSQANKLFWIFKKTDSAPASLLLEFGAPALINMLKESPTWITDHMEELCEYLYLVKPAKRQREQYEALVRVTIGMDTDAKVALVAFGEMLGWDEVPGAELLTVLQTPGVMEKFETNVAVGGMIQALAKFDISGLREFAFVKEDELPEHLKTTEGGETRVKNTPKRKLGTFTEIPKVPKFDDKRYLRDIEICMRARMFHPPRRFPHISAISSSSHS